jgi:hypothetical protein
MDSRGYSWLVNVPLSKGGSHVLFNAIVNPLSDVTRMRS